MKFGFIIISSEGQDMYTSEPIYKSHDAAVLMAEMAVSNLFQGYYEIYVDD